MLLEIHLVSEDCPKLNPLCLLLMAPFLMLLPLKTK